MFHFMIIFFMGNFLSTNSRNKKPCLLREIDNEAPIVFEGAEVLDALCPVSSLTGNRMSIYEAINMVGNEKFSRAIDALLPEIPAIANDSRLSDDDRVGLLMSRLDTGLPSENEKYRDYLSKIVDDFKVDVEKASVKSEETIKFDANDAPSNPAE